MRPWARRKAASVPPSHCALAASISAALTRSEAALRSTRSNFLESSISAASPRLATSVTIARTVDSTSSAASRLVPRNSWKRAPKSELRVSSRIGIGRLVLVSRVRSSQYLAPPSDANFGIKGTLANLGFLVWFLDLKFLCECARAIGTSNPPHEGSLCQTPHDAAIRQRQRRLSATSLEWSGQCVVAQAGPRSAISASRHSTSSRNIPPPENVRTIDPAGGSLSTKSTASRLSTVSLSAW